MFEIKHTLVWYTKVHDEDLPDFDAETPEEAVENQVKWVNAGVISLIEEVDAAGDDIVYTAEVSDEDSDE